MPQKHGYAVLAVPDSGLFVRNEEIQTGHGTTMKWSELLVFSRMSDAEDYAKDAKKGWERGDTLGHRWDFPVIPVLVSDRQGN